MKARNIRYLAYTVCSVLGILIIGFLFFKYVFSAVLPFIIAWGIAFIARPPAAFISKRTGIPIGVARLIITLLGTLAIAALGGLILWRLAGELWRFLSSVTEGKSLSDFLSEYVGAGGIIDMGGSLGEKVGEAIYEFVLSLLRSLASAVSGFAAAIPRALLAVLVTVIASVYFALDLERVNAFIISLLPERVCLWLKRFKSRFFKVGLKYVRAYLLLMLITFVILLVGLLILRAPYALLISMVTALLDILPVIGIGAVLIPWSVISFILGKNFMGVGLLILYALGSIVRQSLEPKIVGKNLGVHPLISLLILYLGYSLLGFLGLFLVPLVVTLVNVFFNKEDTPKVGENTLPKTDGD